MKYEGIFDQDKPVICIMIHPLGTSVGEFRNGWFGKMTIYDKSGDIANQVFDENEEEISEKENIQPEEAFYSKEGRPLKALASNWKDYTEDVIESGESIEAL